MRAALLEAALALNEILHPTVRPDVTIVGGTACLVHGGLRPTEDVDVVGLNAETINAIQEAIQGDPRFTANGLQIGYYSTRLDISVQIELLCAHGNPGSVLPPMGLAVEVMGVRVAQLEDLILSKPVAFMDRGDDSDFSDAEWGLKLLAQRGGSMQGVDEEALREVVADLEATRVWDKSSDALAELLLQVGIQVGV